MKKQIKNKKKTNQEIKYFISLIAFTLLIFLLFIAFINFKVPTVGKATGDGTDGNSYDLAVYNTVTGEWWVKDPKDDSRIIDGTVWGNPAEGTWTTVPGDYNGDGTFDLAVFETTTGEWWVYDYKTDTRIIEGAVWGNPAEGTWTTVPGDYNGDGTFDLVVYDSATGKWYVKDPKDDSIIIDGTVWGNPAEGTWTTVPGDYNGDGTFDLAVFETTTGEWWVRDPKTGLDIISGTVFGKIGDIPVPGDYNGDGIYDLGLYRPSNGKWYISKKRLDNLMMLTSKNPGVYDVMYPSNIHQIPEGDWGEPHDDGKIWAQDSKNVMWAYEVIAGAPSSYWTQEHNGEYDIEGAPVGGVSNGPWWTMDQHKRWWMLESGQSRYWTKVDGTWYYLGIDNKMYDLNDGDTGFYLHTDGRIWKNFDDGEWTIDVNDIWWKWEDGAGGTNKLWVDVDINTGVKDWWWMEYDTTNKKLYDINDVEKGVLREDLRIEKESLGVPLVLYSNRIGGRKWLAQVGDRFCSNSGGFSWCLDDKYHWWKRDGGSDWLKIDEEWFIKEEDKWWVIVDSNSLSDESHGFYWGDNTGRWIPVPGNYYDSYYKSHKASDLTIYDSSTGEWWVKNLKHLAIEGYEWGNGVSFIPVPGDYNGEVLASLCEVEGEVRSVSCGEGICAGNTGQESCSGGQWGESTCNPFEGSLFEICSNSHNEDCDSEVDEPDCLDISDYHEKVFCNYPINRLYIDYEITEPDHSNTEYITYLGMSDAVIINWWFEMGITTTGAEAQEERFILCVASYLASQIPNDPNDPDGPGGPGGPGGSGGDNPGDGVTTCTYFYYSEWGECSSSGTRTRTITSSAPLGCEGGIPVLSEQCTYIPLCTETDWSYSISPTECPFEEEQIKTWTKIGQCEEGVIHETGSITCEYEAPICSDFTYSDWAECTSSGTQGRNISSSAPENCEGGTSINSQSCDYIPLCTESDWGYSIYPMECPPDEEQTKTWAKLGQCENGVNPETESITCEYEIPICSDFTYSDWSECLQSNAQSRTVTSISPENCEGGTPTTSQSCTYIPLCTEADWSFSILPIECPSYEKQIKAWNKIGRCEKGVNHIPETIICEYEAPTCSDFTYSDWTICTSSGTQFRTLISSLPSGCEGGISIISQSCDYVPLCTEADWSYSISPTKCPSDEEQTKTWTKIGQCEEGVNHETGPITCEYEEPTCSNFNYSDWTICTSSGTQYREVVSSLPFGCEGGTPITSQSCTYVPLCTDADWNYSISPRECPSDEEQIKTWTKIGRCEKGVNHETGPITCDYNLRRCTSFSYTSWRNCLQSNIQSRTILSRSPENCEGGTPITSQSCTYVPLCTDADWNYSISPRECPSDEEQIKTWTKIGQCEMGVNHNLETISCSYQIPSCTNFTYSMWGACTVSRTRIRRIISSLPSGCEGGVPVISQSCRYMPVFLSPDSNMEDTEQTFVETISESNQEIKSTEQELEKPEKQTPSEPSLIEQKSPLEKKDSNILLYSVGSILSLGALGGISFFIYLKITAHLLFRKTLQHHSTLKLEKYIRQMLMANYDKETLRKTILKKGWNKKVADYLLKHIEKQ